METDREKRAAFLKAFFEDLHAHPELADLEERTTRKLREALEKAGIPWQSCGTGTGLIATVRGRLPGRTIGLRADLDALPVQEGTGLPYASTVPGCMHACGHDFHTACMLGAALEIKAREAEMAGTVKIVFQPAEEIATGAKRVMASGLLDDVQEFYAGHTYPFFDAGTLGIRRGPVMAAPDAFVITIEGRGAHAGNPHLGIDPIPAACSLVLQAQTLISRCKDAFAPAVLSITHVEAGNTWNVVPGKAMIEGTLRTMSEDVRRMLHERFTAMAVAVAAAQGCRAEVVWRDGPPCVENDAALCDAAQQLALEMGFTVREQENTMGGEDFSEYLRHAPGVFIRIGTGGGVANHQPTFTADPSALAPAAHYFAELALRRAGSYHPM